MNFSGTVNALRLFYNPSAFLPQVTVANFNQLPIPIPPVHGSTKEIKVVVLDKDNCFAEPQTNHVWHEYMEHWAKLKQHYGTQNLLIVSNTAGSRDDIGNKEARVLEQNTGVKVFMHNAKKPGCHDELTQYLTDRGLISCPEEVAIVGDRLMTDVVMANLMKAQSVWIKDGVVPSASTFTQLEHTFYYYYSGK